MDDGEVGPDGLDAAEGQVDAAFFDLDNTVIQGASLFHLAKGLYRRDFFSARVLARGIWLQAWFRMVGRENPGHIADAQAASLAFITGRTVSELKQAATEIYDESIASRIWPGTRKLIEAHLQAGQPVWLVTAAPVEIAGVIAERLGLTGAVGSVPEHVDGVYTGRLSGDLLHGPAKAVAIAALAQRHGFDLARCHAYSDSVNDLPMLELVGHPNVINPDRRLADYAEQHAWPVRDWRTGRRVAKYGLLSAGTAGAVAAGLAVRRRRRV